MGVTDLFKKMYPFISVAAAAMGGPLGSMAASALGKAIGADVKTEDVASKIQELSMSEDGRLKLEAAENDFKLAMAKLGYDDAEALAKTAAADRDSARNREIQVKDWTPRIMAFTVVVLCFAGEGWYFTHGAPERASAELVGRILGTLDSALILVLSYYFGSSAGSDRKTEIIANGNGTAH